MEALLSLQDMLSSAGPELSFSQLQEWLLRPELVLALGFLFVVVTPLVEEGAKGLAVPVGILLGSRRPDRDKRRVEPSPAQGWMWGITAGLGFALLESLFNGAISMPVWALVILLRVGTMLMHATTSGLTGLGWARTLSGQGVWPLVWRFGAGVAAHALWNFLSLLIFFSALWSGADAASAGRLYAGGLGVVLGLAGLVVHSALIIGILVLTTRHVAGLSPSSSPVSVAADS
jgi:RsiW-degrading membrane proteinase PrsW (M82 family)